MQEFKSQSLKDFSINTKLCVKTDLIMCEILVFRCLLMFKPGGFCLHLWNVCREFNGDPIAYTVSGSNLTFSSAESPLIRLLDSFFGRHDTGAELHNVRSFHLDVKYGSRGTLYVLLEMHSIFSPVWKRCTAISYCDVCVAALVTERCVWCVSCLWPNSWVSISHTTGTSEL